MLRKSSTSKLKGPTLSQLLAAQRAARSNPLPATRPSLMGLGRSNPMGAVKSHSKPVVKRKNPLDVNALVKEARDAQKAYEAASKRYQQSGKSIDKAQMVRAKNRVDEKLALAKKSRSAVARSADLLRSEMGASASPARKVKSRKRKASPVRRKRRNPAEASSPLMMGSLAGMLGAIENGRKRKPAKRKASPVRRKRRNPAEASSPLMMGSLAGMLGAIENGRKRKPAKRKASPIRRKRRNPAEASSPLMMGSLAGMLGAIENGRKRKPAKRKASPVRRKRRNPAEASSPLMMGRIHSLGLASRIRRRNPAEMDEIEMFPYNGGMVEVDTIEMDRENGRKRKRKVTSKRKAPASRKVSPLRKRRVSSRRRNPSEVVMMDVTPFASVEDNRENGRKRKPAKRKASVASRKRKASPSRKRKSSARKNPLMVLENPSRKRSSSGSRALSAVASSGSASRRRAKRTKGGFDAATAKILSMYGPYTVAVERNGKVHVLHAQKSSSDYKSAKAKGLSGTMRNLQGKANTKSSLSLRSVNDVFKVRKASVAQIQKALNTWAGAIDGGKVSGVTRDLIQREMLASERSRKNPAHALVVGRARSPRGRMHGLGLAHMHSNPSSAVALHRMHGLRMNDEPSMGKIVGTSIGAGLAGLYGSNLVASAIQAFVSPQSRRDNSVASIAAEAAPLAAIGAATYLAYREDGFRAEDKSKNALFGGLLVGSIYSLVARNLVSMLNKFPLFSTIAIGDGAFPVESNVIDTTATTPTPAPTPASQGYHHMSKVGRIVEVPANTRQVGRIVEVPADTRQVGAYVRTPPVGTYVRKTGEYVPTAGTYVRKTGEYVPTAGAAPQGRRAQIGAMAQGRRAQIGAAPAVEEQSTWAPPKVVENNGYEIFSRPAQEASPEAIRLSLNRQIPLTNTELEAEGLPSKADPDGGIDVGGELRVIRTTRDVAKQITDLNLGQIIGPSRIIPGAQLVFVTMVDTMQDTPLSNRLRLNVDTQAPRDAAFLAKAGGVFSQGVFKSIFPAIDNGPTYTPEVKIRRS